MHATDQFHVAPDHRHRIVADHRERRAALAYRSSDSSKIPLPIVEGGGEGGGDD